MNIRIGTGLVLALFVASCAQSQTLSKQEREQFRQTMSGKSLPRVGCFTAHYPTTTWQPVQCGPPSKYPAQARLDGPRPLTVGDGNDNFISVTGTISSATGSFDSVTGLASNQMEAGWVPPNPLTHLSYNAYTLQLNTNSFNTPLCGATPNCVGWEQFVYGQGICDGGACLFIQYWLFGYGNPCPANWTSFGGSASSSAGCYINSPTTVVPTQQLNEFGDMQLTGTASTSLDTVMLATPNGDVQANGQSSLLNLAAGWTGGEFNVVGDGNGTEAFFLNAGTILTVRLTASNGTTNPPQCVSGISGYHTVETNNLNLVGLCTAVGGSAPAIVYQEAGGGGLPEGYTVGDPHLTTIYGTHYDLQATGDFVLAEAGPDLEIQGRQAQWSPYSVAVNTGLGVRMGSTRIGVCLNGIEVDGAPTQLANGEERTFARDAVTIARQNDRYVISRPTGDVVVAQLKGTWMDVSARIGAASSSTVRGLLGGDRDGRLLMGDGTALHQPITWDAFRLYADSWRVAAADSLLCHSSLVAPGFPKKPFTADDLTPGEQERAGTVCRKAGVQAGPLMNDCILDVSLLKQDAAADIFLHHPPVIRVEMPH